MKASGVLKEAGARTRARGRLAGIRRWLLKGGASVADQALLSGANFLLSVLLGRWLQPSQYGAFALAYSMFQLLGTFHTAVFTEPLLVFGAGRHAGRFREYVGRLILGHLGTVLPLGLLALAAAACLGGPAPLRQAASAAAAASPFILLLWLLRRAFYVIVAPEWSVLGAGCYFALLLAAALGLRSAGRLSPGSAFLSMGGSALLVSLLLTARLRPRLAAGAEPSAAAVAREHWGYARWAVGSAALTWIPGNLYFALLPAWVGLEGTAALRALTNLVMPVTHAISALSLLLMPLLARRRGEGPRGMRRVMGVFLALFLAGAAAYETILVLFGGRLVGLLYGGKYGAIVPLLPLVGLVPFLAGFTSVVGAALRALERPSAVFWSYLAASLVAAGAGILLGRSYGVGGAMGGLLLSSATTAAMFWLFFRRLEREWA